MASTVGPDPEIGLLRARIVRKHNKRRQRDAGRQPGHTGVPRGPAGTDTESRQSIGSGHDVWLLRM
jgi:hypothetical protein